MQKNAVLCTERIASVRISPLGLFDYDEDAAAMEEEYGIF